MKFGKLFWVCFVAGIIYFMSGSRSIVHASEIQQGEQGCTFLNDGLLIPEGGNWLQICLTDRSAPEGSTVTEINVILLLDHPDPGQLEILLSRTDSDIVLSLSPSEITKDGVGRFIQIHEFDGSPSEGEWIIRIRDTQAEVHGSLIGASIAPFYLPIGQIPVNSRAKFTTHSRVMITSHDRVDVYHQKTNNL